MEETITRTLSRSILLKERFRTIDFCLCDRAGEEVNFSRDEDFYSSEINSELSQIYYWLKNSEVVGFVFFRHVVGEVEIIHWAVKEKNKGHGKRLFSEFLCFIMPHTNLIKLEVNAENKAALHIYQSMGFEKNYLRQNYYGPNEHAILMSRNGLKTKF